jgi:signal transduction histidine kinase
MLGSSRAASAAAVDGRRLRARRLPAPAVLAIGAACSALAVVVSVEGPTRFAYRNLAAHVAIHTAAVVIALLAAVLLYERFRQTALAHDLLLAAALAVFSAAGLVLSVVPAIAGLDPDAKWWWALLASRLLGAGLLAAACFARAEPLRAPTVTARRTLIGCFTAVVALSVLALSPAAPPWPTALGHPLQLLGRSADLGLVAFAAFGFARKAAAEGDELLSWLALGTTLGAFRRLNDVLYPLHAVHVVDVGDLLMLTACLVLLVGLARQIRAYHQALAEKAVLEERRRLARDLHDGLAQDLAYLVSRSRGPGASERLDQLATTAARALEESRAAIAALACPLNEPLEDALVRVAGDVAERLGAAASFEIQPRIEVTPPLREALLRIAREGVTNAVRHGGAAGVTVSLTQAESVKMTVADNGCGFDPSAPRQRAGGGFGLISMRERAEALGGALALTSATGLGTTLEVVVPCPSR